MQPLLQWKRITYRHRVFVGSRIQHAMRMRRNILSCVARLAVRYFFHTRLSEKKIHYSQNLYFDFLCNFCLKRFSVKNN